MLKIIGMLFSFIKELFRDKRNEIDFKHSGFNPLTFLRFISIIILVIYAVAVTDRAIGMAKTIIDLKKDNVNCETKK